MYSFVYRPLKDDINRKYTIVYYSLELSAQFLYAKLLSLYLYEEYGVVVSFKDLMSWTTTLDDDRYEYVKKGKAWLEEVSKHLIIFDSKLNRDSFYSTFSKILEQHGTTEVAEGGRRKIYTPNDPDEIIIGIVDHLGLVTPMPGSTKKMEMDAVSNYAVTFRERCGASFVFLQQENRNSADINRVKMNRTECSSEDLADTSSSLQDCEVCIGVYYPLKHKQKTCHEFPIIAEDSVGGFKGLRDRFRSLTLIKNRRGETDKYDDVNFFGEIGLFREFPDVDQISDFRQYTSLKYKPKENPSDFPQNNEFEETLTNVTFDL